ncbi:PREDICTED: aspartate-rich protein 1-like isoform X3 [Cercocebus atys]|uniref:aspartate-rich protein 1-like isoform X3 n=1 Tax=Cercocebus atys TaxID=9531 RepID=UPI0005F381BA|nr:PREDICTED: aspartate-rich protein 1-like isoform X3 [Cercocebus atys]
MPQEWSFIAFSCLLHLCAMMAVTPAEIGPREGSLSLKSLPPSEEDYDDAQILPSPIQGSSEENLNLVCPPPSEADDWDDDEDYYIIEILPLSDQGTYLELTHFLRNKLSGFNI